MNTFLAMLGAFASIAVAYVLLSGVAFVSTYRWPDEGRTALYSRLFRPLDALSRAFPSRVGRAYNGFHFWCYRTFAGKEKR